MRRYISQLVVLLGLAAALAGYASTNTDGGSVAVVLGTELVVKQTTPQIAYELRVSEPARLTLTLEMPARVTEVRMFECSLPRDVSANRLCIINGVLHPLAPESQGTLSLLVEPAQQSGGTSEHRSIQLRSDAAGKIDF